MKLDTDHPAPPVTTNDFTVLGPEHPHTVESLRELVNLYESWDKPDEAAAWRAYFPRAEGARE